MIVSVEKIGKKIRNRQPWVIFQFLFFFDQKTIKYRKTNIVASQYITSLWRYYNFFLVSKKIHMY